VLAPQLLDLCLERARLLDLALGACPALRDHAHRRVEPEPFQHQPQRDEQGCLDDEAVVEIKHGVRRGGEAKGERAPGYLVPSE
jgi:hypothetical protein